MKYYFDNAATTFPKPPQVIAAVTECMSGYAVNAGRGVYDIAIKADQVIAQTRHKVRKLLGAATGQVIFSPSATIALNQIVLGLSWRAGQVIYTSPFEHNAVARVVQSLVDNYGVVWRQLPFDVHSLSFDMAAIQNAFFREPPAAVIMAHVSNVIGTVTPIGEIANLAKLYEATVIIDGAQAGPLLPLCGEAIDFYAFSGHKTFYGPFGIAGFWTNNRKALNPIVYGGTGSHSELLVMPEQLPYTLEVGSPNIVAIAGLNAACDWLESIGGDKILVHERTLMQQLVAGLEKLSGAKYWFSADHAGVISFVVNTYTSQEVGMILNQEFQMAVRTGLHCAPLAHQLINTIGRGGTVRVGFSWFNTSEEVAALVTAIAAISEI